jgi:hypothetical protein
LDKVGGQRYALYQLGVLLLEMILRGSGVGEKDLLCRSASFVVKGEIDVPPIARQLRARLFVPGAQLEISVGGPL